MTCSLLQRRKIDHESRLTSLILLSHFLFEPNPHPKLLSSLSRIPCFWQDFSESRSLSSSQIPYPVNKSYIFPHPALYFSQIPGDPENTLPNPVKKKKKNVESKTVESQAGHLKCRGIVMLRATCDPIHLLYFVAPAFGLIQVTLKTNGKYLYSLFLH